MTETFSLARAHVQLLEMRQQLLDRRTGLESERRDELDRDRPVDYLDSASRDENLGLLDSLGVAETRLLREIDEALNRIYEGTYGTCEECGEEIDPRRLEVMPYARLCVACREIQARESAELR
jgi:DnaK suppressor protein